MGPKFPEAGAVIWQIFCRLSSARSRGASLGYQDIAAYNAVAPLPLKQWEIEAIWALDRALSNPQDHSESS